MQYAIRYFCTSHTGNVRDINQDNFICNGLYLEEGTSLPLVGKAFAKSPAMFAVFDGMGGEERGEVASLIAAKKAKSIKYTKNGVRDLKEYCLSANSAILRFANECGIFSTGTTVAALLFYKNRITLCNIGDSKIFRFSGEKLSQISEDHVGISAFGKKPPLIQNLGIPPEEMIIEPYFSRGVCKECDRYLICSDGLTDAVTSDEIAAAMADSDICRAGSSLLTLALEKGGKDNTTVIALEIIKEKKYNFFKQIRE